MDKTSLQFITEWCDSNTDVKEQIEFIEEQVSKVHNKNEVFFIRVLLVWVTCVYGKYLKKGTLPYIVYIPEETDPMHPHESFNLNIRLLVNNVENEDDSAEITISIYAEDTLENARNFTHAWNDLEKAVHQLTGYAGHCLNFADREAKIDLSTECTFTHMPPYTDKMLVWSQEQKDELMSYASAAIKMERANIVDFLRKLKGSSIPLEEIISILENKEQEKTNQSPVKPCMQTIKQKAKQFMNTQEIKDLGLDPFMETAGVWRKVAPTWVPEYIPDEAKVASFAVSDQNDPSVMETIIIWNTDTFDYEAYLKRSNEHINK